jgi:transposase
VWANWLQENFGPAFVLRGYFFGGNSLNRCPYNRFVRWRRAGVWSKIMNALAGSHDAAAQMIDTSIVRVHQHGACITRTEDSQWAAHEAG